MTKISVLMPVFNASQFLKQAIDSIVKQSFADWELIVINDGSTDNSEDIVASYTDPRIKYYKNENNIGLIATLNKGIALCEGEYIARMDADDISIPNRLEEQIKFMDKHPHHAMCGGKADVIDNNGNKKGEIVNICNDEYLRIHLLFSVPFIHPSMMLRSSIVKQYSFDINFKYAEDYDLWCRIAKEHKIANLPNTILKYRWHATNVSVANTDAQEKIKDLIIKRELNIFGINPTNEELQLHKVSFIQHSAKEKTERNDFYDFTRLSDWFSKIINTNKASKKYNQQALTAYLWSRWIVVCLAQKKYLKIFRPGFVNPDLNVYIRTFKLVLFLAKK